jgi:peptidoglycan-associated lipoprotein
MKASALAVPLVVLAAIAFCTAALATSGEFGPWSQATRVEAIPGTDPSFNGNMLDGCPFISRDGKTFYMASRRLTGDGDQNNDINIWVSTRAAEGDPWGAPVLVGEPVSIDTTAAGAAQVNDFCPTLARDGHEFYFVSNRAGGCGGDDMYVTRLRPDGWDPIANLGCDVNTPANEASPFPLPQSHSGPVLYFSSTITGAGDLYLSEWHGGAFQGRELVPGVNTASVEGQPNVRRDGLEIFFFSNRPGSLGNDIYAATRASTADAWSAPVNLGPAVNGTTNSAETRPSLSWDGTTLYFGSTRTGGGAEGDADHYVTTRQRLNGD